jgi:hypothetical protein
MQCNQFNIKYINTPLHISASNGHHQRVFQHYREIIYMYVTHMSLHRGFNIKN